MKTVLLDVDGTLIDSNDAHAEAWATALSEHGISVPVQNIRRLIGMGGDKLMPAVAGVESTSSLGVAIAHRKQAAFADRLPDLRATRGARRLVEFLRDRDITCVVATSAGEDELGSLLRQAGLDTLLSLRATSSDVEESKPDPDIVHAALAKASAAPDTSLLIGDTPYDIDAARGAGIPAIALRCGGYWSDVDFQDALDIRDDPEALLAYWSNRGTLL